MTAGLLIRNDNNELLINDTYSNLYLFRKIKLDSLPYQTIGSGSQAPKLYYTDIQENEIIAPIAKTSGGELRAFSVHGAGNVYYSNSGQWQIYVPHGEDISDVYVYVFGINTSTAQTGNFGLQVFDENGVAIYNSNDKSMRILHYANNVGDTSKTDATLDGYVVPNNKVCAIFNCAITRMAMGAGQNRPLRLLNAYISSSGSVLQQNAGVGTVPVSFAMGDYIGYMVVDVTNY